MLRTIILREILEHIKSLKLQIGFFITIGLVVLSTVINIGDYAKRQQDYLDAIRKRPDGPWSATLFIYRQPQTLSVLAKGKDIILNNKAVASAAHKPVQLESYLDDLSQPKALFYAFETIDYAFIVKTILSLLVLFLVYNSISGEKSQGTLKQTLSNNIPRHVIILGKFIGGISVISASLLISTLVAVFILIVHPSISITGGDLIRISLLFLASMIYLAFFYNLGLLFSVLFNRPPLTLTFLVQIWVFLLFIVPNLSIFMADTTYTLPSIAERWNEQDAIGRKYYEENPVDFSKYNRFEIAMMTADFYYPFHREYQNRLTGQSQRAQIMASFSPSVLYDRVMLRYARTGIEEFESFLESVSVYWENTFRYRSTDTEKSYEERMKNPPEFIHIPETIETCFIKTFSVILMLFLFDMSLFLLANTAFLRKDVR